MKKRISLLLVLAALMALTACGNGEEKGEEKQTDDQSTAQAGVTYPLTVTDQAGRQVVIEEQPQRIVSGYYISTSSLIALDLDEKMVGIEAKADKRAIYRLAAPALVELPSVGSAKEFDLEGCAALQPDLVILPLKLKSAAQSLEELGIDVLLVNPENQQLLEEMIGLIAAAADAGDRAEELLTFIRTHRGQLEEALAGAEKPSVYLAGNSSMLSTAGSAMYQSDMIDLAGGANVAGAISDSYWVEISYEQLLTWDPACILLASDASYTPADVLADPNLADCRAVKEGRVLQLPDDAEAWDSPVPGGILGSVWLAARLHPEQISESSAAAVIDEFYQTFYGFTYREG